MRPCQNKCQKLTFQYIAITTNRMAPYWSRVQRSSWLAVTNEWEIRGYLFMEVKWYKLGIIF